MKTPAAFAIPFLIVGCGSSEETSGAAHPSSGASGSGGAGFEVSGTIIGYDDGAPIEGATICAYDEEDQELVPCQATRQDGAYSFTLPVGVPLELFSQADGFASVSNALVATAESEQRIAVQLVSDATFSQLVTLADPVVGAAPGIIGWTFVAADGTDPSPLAGGSIVALPNEVGTADTGGKIVYYADGSPSENAVEADETGRALVVGLSPTAYEFDLAGPDGYDCDSSPFQGGELHVIVRVRSNTMSEGFARCRAQK